MNKIVALIPARMASTRLPEKLMKILHGKTIIRRTYEAVVNSNLFDEVIVVCDDEHIKHEIEQAGGKAIMSLLQHESGTDRIAEVAANLDFDIVVNIQGDEPFINISSLKKVIELCSMNHVSIASIMLPITDKEKISNPNCVKVVVDKNFRALYFSRAAIPYVRDESIDQPIYQHIGVYAFKKQTLLDFTKLPTSKLEQIEKLENLRMLENGFDVHLAIINHVGISIDTEDDFKRAEDYMLSIK